MDKESQQQIARSSDGTVQGEDMEIEVVSDDLDFSRLREEWETLLEHSPGTPFQSFDWAFLWWKYFGGRLGQKLHILLLRQNRTVVGIAPLFQDERRMAGISLYRRLRFLGCDIGDSPVACIFDRYTLTDYLDFIIRPGFETDVIRCFVDHLNRNHFLFDEIELASLRSESALLQTLPEEAANRGFQSARTRSDVCPQVAVPSSVEAYLSSLESNHRRRLRQAMRASAEEGMFSIEVPQTLNGAEKAFSELVRLHQQRWNTLGYPGLFYDRRFERFQRDLLKAWHGRGWIWLKTARAVDRTIAARLAFKHKGILFDYLSGVDEAAAEAKRRPGLALILAMVGDAVKEGCRVVDFLRGGEQYKLQLATSCLHNWNITVLNPVTRSSIRVRLYRLFRSGSIMRNRLEREWLMMKVFSQHDRVFSGLRKYAGSVRDRVSAKLHPVVSEPKNPLSIVNAPIRQGLQQLKQTMPLAHRITQSLVRDRDIPFSRKAFKAVVFFKALLLSKLYLRKCDRVGKRSRTRGRPYVVNDGRIVIGHDFNLSSRIVRSELATGHRGAIEIGDEVSINFGALISSQELVRIGNRVRIGPYSIITDSDFHAIGDRFGAPTGVPTVIGDEVWLGARVTVLKGSRIGEGSVIAAGSVVSGEIPPHVIAAGVPARVVKQTHENPELKKRKNGAREGTLPADVLQRVKKTFAATFGVNGNLELSWGPREIARWDSLGHLKLILNLESEFGITIAEEDMVHLFSVSDACAVVAKYRTNGTPIQTKETGH